MNFNQYPLFGIDQKLFLIQNVLANGLGFENVDFYGRAQSVVGSEKGELTPCVLIAPGEYKSAYYNDKTAKGGNVFFIEQPNHTSKNGLTFTAKVKIVFMLNLTHIKANDENTNDSQVHDICLKVLKKSGLATITGIEKGVKEVLTGFNFTAVITNDVRPFHIFAINTEIKYLFNCLN